MPTCESERMMNVPFAVTMFLVLMLMSSAVLGRMEFTRRVSAVTEEDVPSHATEVAWNNKTIANPLSMLGAVHRARGRQTLSLSCHDPNPYLKMSVSISGTMNNVQEVTVTVSGNLVVSSLDFIAVYTSGADDSNCPSTGYDTALTGDISLSDYPYTCTTPIKIKHVSSDPDYLAKKNKEGHGCIFSSCLFYTYTGKVTFRMVNLRDPIFFVYMMGPMVAPCILKTSKSYSWTTPKAPLYGRLAAVDSTGTQMRLTWSSASGLSQSVYYGRRGGHLTRVASSLVSTFSKGHMCGAPATDEGYHNPGFIHTALMTGLTPDSYYDYYYGRANEGGYSTVSTMKTLPAAGALSESGYTRISFLADMGKNDQDESELHFNDPGALSVIAAVYNNDIKTAATDAVFHLGDISYATGYLTQWETFLENIGPLAQSRPYMMAIGNHERDFPGSGSYYHATKDSGGECGVPYYKYFPMPAPKGWKSGINKDTPWYSIDIGLVHVIVMSTENDWTVHSPQWTWLNDDLTAAVKNHANVPWIIFTGHRPPYSSVPKNAFVALFTGEAVDKNFAPALEAMTHWEQVDLAIWGHVHNYERTCQVLASSCVKSSRAVRQPDGAVIHTFQNNNRYYAPVHVVAGNGGFSLDSTSSEPHSWSEAQESTFGYLKVSASRTYLDGHSIHANGSPGDHFQIVK